MDLTELSSKPVVMLKYPIFTTNIVLLLFSTNVNSAEYRFTPGLSLSTIYIDNAYTLFGEEKTSDTIYEVSPQFQLAANGRQMDVSASYKMQALKYDKADENEVNHQVDARTNIEVLKENIFLDADVNRKKFIIDYNEPGLLDDYSLTTNKTDITTYHVTPQLKLRLWNGATMEVKKTFTQIEYGEEEKTRYKKEDIYAIARTETLGGDLLLGLNYKESKDKSTDFEYRQEFASIAYSLTQKIKLFSEYGHEFTNRNTSLTTNESIYVKNGVTWIPSSRSKLELSHGKRGFGKTSSLDAVFKSKTKVLNLSYSKDITSDAIRYGEQISEEQDSLPGNELPGLDNRLYIREVYKLKLSKSTAKTLLGINYSKEKRGFEDGAQNEEHNNYKIDGAWRASSKTSFVISYAENKIEFETTGFENSTTSKIIGVSRKLRRTGNLSLNYSKSQQQFYNGFAKYETQIVKLSLLLPF